MKDLLKKRFLAHPERHEGLAWEQVEAVLTEEVLSQLQLLEDTKGEPDVIFFDENHILFCECSKQTPGRRSYCYDQEALDKRKEHKPEDSAMAWVERNGFALCDWETYLHLQSLGDFDTTTSSWLLTPLSVRSLGGANFGDKRYATTWRYHNGADSYYGSRSFRCLLKVDRA